MEINFDLPWVIFEIRKQIYAISTRLVTGIMSIPPVIYVAEAPELFLGACNVRGDVIPVLDTRKLLGFDSADKEAEETIKLLEEKKDEHIMWVTVLRRSVEGGRRFTLPLEPASCSFGRWYYSFIRKGSSFVDELKKLEAPHNEMHDYAKKIDSLRGQDGSYDESAMDLLKLAERCSQKVVSILDGIMQSIRETLTPMIISLSFPSTRDTCMAFTVDNVKAVDEVEMLDKKENSNMLFMSGRLCGIAHNSKIPGEILLMDDLEIVKLVSIYNEKVKQKKAALKKKDGDAKAEKKEKTEDK